ncbi:MAG TPA: glycosyltransferase family 1 protein, partial [Candidatus Saccharimonadales bacterium]|nr:glycosyltransferase family 1 protein [Candidatus Saccharimonadales bacterium]
DKIFVTYEAADRIMDKPQPLPRVAGKKFLMYVGRATPHKNLARLVAAFELLTQNHPDLYLVLAGKNDANYKKIGQLVTDRRLAHSVILADHVSEAELRWLYEHTQAYIFPSLSEGFGLPAVEAMLHGAPVICSKATSLPEVCDDAALYFDPMSTKDMAAQIDKVLSNTGLRTNLIYKGKVRAARFSWKKMAEQTLKIYEAGLK